MLPRSIFAVALLATLAPTAALAAWPHDPSLNVPLVARAGEQEHVVAVPDGAGGAIVFWEDARGASVDVYAQRIDGTGRALWATDGVPVCVATGSQSQLDACSDGAGGAVVVWTDARAGVATDIYAQCLNASGATVWTANGLAICTYAQIQSSPRVAPDGFGGVVIAWQDFGNTLNYNIYAQRVTAAGTTLWTNNGATVSAATGDQVDPVIVADEAGGAYVAWSDGRTGSHHTADLYAQRLGATGVAIWAPNGIGVATTPSFQFDPEMVADGAGGFIVVWSDGRNGTDADTYVQRFGPDGLPLWVANGRLVCNVASSDVSPRILSDGAQGAIIAWEDNRAANADVYAQRVSGGGTPLWTANGIPVVSAASGQGSFEMVSDGAGGAIFAWVDYRSNGESDLYAQRIGSNGLAQWPTNGVAVSLAAGYQLEPALAPDGRGGALIAWGDGRTPANGSDVYGQRVDRFGPLGDPAPTIASVRDVPGDQGGRVKVSWDASWLDADPTYGIVEYRLWRSAPQALRKRGATSDPDEAAAKGLRLVLPFASSDYAWELVGAQAAAILPSYSMLATTTSDSSAAGNWRTAFMVEARASTAVGGDRWYSLPDSGWSVDNLAPAMPAPFTGQYLGAQTALDWNANGEPDIAGYRIYRGGSTSFAPSPANLLAFTADTDWLDPAGAPWVYKLTAVDVHGNESAPATLVPAGTTGVDDARHAFAFAAPTPNPASRAAVLRFTLPVAGDVSLVVYDANGRAVRTLADGARAAGAHDATWDLRDDAGRPVAAGLYFAKLVAGADRTTRRIVVTR